MLGIYYGDVFQLLFMVMFFLVFVIIFVRLIKGIFIWNKNNHSPRLCVEATVVSKRSDVHHYHNNTMNNGMHGSTSTSYYVCFEFESKDRLELKVTGYEYGMMAEGDVGKLTFQGSRYLGFERNR